MRTFWIITLVLVTVLVMATAASASVRDSVASLVGDRSGAAEDSGDGGTFTVEAVKTDVEAAASGTGAAWTLENGDATTDGDGTYTFRSNTVTEPAEDTPDGYAERDADFSGDDVDPVPPVQPVDPIGDQDEEPKAKKGEKAPEEPVAE